MSRPKPTVLLEKVENAINLAKKLNKQFNTDQFTVVVLDKGKQIYP